MSSEGLILVANASPALHSVANNVEIRPDSNVRADTFYLSDLRLFRDLEGVIDFYA